MRELEPHPAGQGGMGRDPLAGWTRPFISFDDVAAQWPPILALHWLRESDRDAWFPEREGER